MADDRSAQQVTAEQVLVDHQRQSSGCLCGWAELGKSHPRHQVAALTDAGLLADPATIRWEGMAEALDWAADWLESVGDVNEKLGYLRANAKAARARARGDA